MMHETPEMKKTADKIESDYHEGVDVMNRINAYIKKYLIPFCKDCKTENVTPKHDCELTQQRKQNAKKKELEQIDHMDYV